MQSPQVAGTGVLHQIVSAAEDDFDLAAVDEILSQHSTHTPSKIPGPQPQEASPSPHIKPVVRGSTGSTARDAGGTFHSIQQHGNHALNSQEQVVGTVADRYTCWLHVLRKLRSNLVIELACACTTMLLRPSGGLQYTITLQLFTGLLQCKRMRHMPRLNALAQSQ